MDFDRFHRGRVSCSVTIVVKEVAACCDSGAVWFIFFWSICDGVAWICYFLSRRNIPFVDPFQDIESFYVAVALKETSKFIHTGLFPSTSYVVIGVVDEVLPCSKLFKFIVSDSATREGEMWVVSVGATKGKSSVCRSHLMKITGGTGIFGAVRCGGTKCYRPFWLVTFDAW